EHVERSLAAAGEFGAAWQDFITRTAWGDAWGDPTLAWKTRSLLTLALMTALHREEEFKLHLRPALANGVTTAELAALVRHCAVYAGIPAGNAAMRWTREKLGEELRGVALCVLQARSPADGRVSLIGRRGSRVRPRRRHCR